MQIKINLPVIQFLIWIRFLRHYNVSVTQIHKLKSTLRKSLKTKEKVKNF